MPVCLKTIAQKISIKKERKDIWTKLSVQSTIGQLCNFKKNWCDTSSNDSYKPTPGSIIWIDYPIQYHVLIIGGVSEIFYLDFYVTVIQGHNKQGRIYNQETTTVADISVRKASRYSYIQLQSRQSGTNWTAQACHQEPCFPLSSPPSFMDWSSTYCFIITR